MRSFPLRQSLPLIVVAVGSLFALGSPANAGGWAVTSLDPVPPIEVGRETPIGFTVLQHGSHPAGELTDVSITTTSPDGATEQFPAVAEGPAGHYVARVIFRTAGTYQWSVKPGWFSVQSLGVVTVPAPAIESTSRTAPLAVTFGRLLFPLSVALFTALALRGQKKTSRTDPAPA